MYYCSITVILTLCIPCFEYTFWMYFPEIIRLFLFAAEFQFYEIRCNLRMSCLFQHRMEREKGIPSQILIKSTIITIVMHSKKFPPMSHLAAESYNVPHRKQHSRPDERTAIKKQNSLCNMCLMTHLFARNKIKKKAFNRNDVKPRASLPPKPTWCGHYKKRHFLPFSAVTTLNNDNRDKIFDVVDCASTRTKNNITFCCCFFIIFSVFFF